jgi:hypothetical protein
MARKDTRLDFEKMIDAGENPKGFTAQTCNGTAHWKGTGWNRDGRGGWAAGCWGPGSEEQLSPDATRPSGRSNRTGE